MKVFCLYCVIFCYGFDAHGLLNNFALLEPKEKCACEFFSKSAVIKYHQLLSKVIGSINGKSRFNQLALTSYSSPSN